MRTKIDQIKVGKNFSRTFGVGDVKELVDSMKQHGQITPVIISRDGDLIAGFRRITAAKELGWSEVDAVICEGHPGILNLIENLNREGLTLWEEIQGVRDAFGAKATQAEVCRELSKSKSWAKPRMAIWDLPQDFIDKVRTGQSGIKEINGMLMDKRGPSAVSKNMGFPSQPEIKLAITKLMESEREVEARALSYAVGGITIDELLNTNEKGDC